jgi:hypothetical protein
MSVQFDRITELLRDHAALGATRPAADTLSRTNSDMARVRGDHRSSHRGNHEHPVPLPGMRMTIDDGLDVRAERIARAPNYGDHA